MSEESNAVAAAYGLNKCRHGYDITCCRTCEDESRGRELDAALARVAELEKERARCDNPVLAILDQQHETVVAERDRALADLAAERDRFKALDDACGRMAPLVDEFRKQRNNAHDTLAQAVAVMLDAYMALEDDARHESECQRELADNHKRVAKASLHQILQTLKVLP